MTEELGSGPAGEARDGTAVPELPGGEAGPGGGPVRAEADHGGEAGEAEPDGEQEPAGVRGYVMTRGVERDKDYRFLGAAPAALWWSAYRDHADTNYPTLLVEAGEGGWRAFVSGIPSARRDEVSTPIRFTLALTGATAAAGGPGAPVRLDRVVRLVALWLEAFTAQEGRERLGRLLDGLFPDEAEVVELRRRRDPQAARTVRERVTALLDALDPPPESGADAAGGPARALPAAWFGAARSEQGASAFVARVRDLLSGEREGRALVLNLVEDQAEAPARVGRESLAVLAVDGGPVRPQPFAVTVPGPLVVTPPGPPVETVPGPPKKFGPLHRRALLFLATPAGAAAMVLAIWYLTHRHHGGKP
ncbi:hypothetical protein GCM10018781_65560 [Kitasatospora indigofera]|uniref:Uncharacterized protein n=1 Tax=Kitasatospora indigofera TaxID=67307 RepID=A0A919L3C9_9ACTN|nr:hypothetical protein [Kitasatospora indigofera]GHH81924.1 hypothetical protein GCM10018781_65560 [Kitasatospora indigofera]